MPILFILLFIRQNIFPQKDAIQREQSQACLSYAEREHLRPKVKNIRLSQYVKERFSEWKCKRVCNFPSVEFFEAKPQRTLLREGGESSHDGDVLSVHTVPSALGVRSMGSGSCAHAPVATVSSSAMMYRNRCFIVL